MEDMVEAIPE